ncbi:transcription factor RelB isoform X2 [Harpia harpyja]|uniref:transcription factor RelB isoform X2 n=1 Tax=Harpia harpyja TaxID=202280 RepID=UPI0022B1C809|nr:transcription factor RelB isoform X2 [Harpia harpyja]
MVSSQIRPPSCPKCCPKARPSWWPVAPARGATRCCTQLSPARWRPAWHPMVPQCCQLTHGPPQLTQSLSTLSLSPKLVPRGTTGASGRHRWSPVAGHSKEQLEGAAGAAQIGDHGAAQAAGHALSLRVRGPLGRQHPGREQHRRQQDAASHRAAELPHNPRGEGDGVLGVEGLALPHPPPRPGGQGLQQRLCEVVLKPQTNPKHSFSNLGIQCVKKKEIEAAIEKKLQLGIDPFKAGSLKNHQEVDMNVVRICFQASYKDGSGQTQHLSPVLSEPIFDKKSTNTSELRICRMNKESGPCTGGEELYLLCDKVQKEDIAVVFRKETWEARADFSQADVHRQVAIVFKTPPYQHLELAEPVEVEVFLQRLTDSVCSESFRFTYLPKDHDAYGVNVKRKRGMPDVLEELSGADPYGIEAKRRKKPLGYMDHFAPLPVADAFALFTAEPEPFDALAQLYVPFAPPALREGLPPPYPPTDFPACLGPELLAEPYGSPPRAPPFPPTDPHPTASLVGTHMFPGHYKEADLRLGDV